jgi:hypothetical protein
MDKLFSTMDVHPRDRFDYWHDVACRTIAGHSSKPASKQNFEAHIEGGSLADVGLVLFENSPMTVTRTALHIAQTESDSLFVCQQVRGSVAIEQNGRQVILQAGDVTLVDPLLPYFARFSDASKLLVLKVPRADLRARLGETRDSCNSNLGVRAPVRFDHVVRGDVTRNCRLHSACCGRNRQRSNARYHRMVTSERGWIIKATRFVHALVGAAERAHSNRIKIM